MKRYIISFLGILVLLNSLHCNAFVEMPNLSDYSDAELIELLSSVNQELSNRKIEKTAEFAAGKYIIGVDIPAGTYIMFGIGTEKNDSLSVYEYDSENEKWKYKTMYFLHDDKAVHFTLAEGQKIEATCAFSLTISSGAHFH